MDDEQQRREARLAARMERAKQDEARARQEMADLEAGEFGFLVRYEQREDADPIETPLGQSFWGILSHMDMSEEEQAAERRFVMKVCEALSRFQKEDPVKILWDIDDTLGRNNNEHVFVFRPTFLPMLELIRAEYTQAQHGFLTDRRGFDDPANENTTSLVRAIDERWPLSRELMISSSNQASDALDEAIAEYQMAADDLFDAVTKQSGSEAAMETFRSTRRCLGGATQVGTQAKMRALYGTGLLQDTMTIVVDDYYLPLYLGDRGVFVDFNARAKTLR